MSNSKISHLSINISNIIQNSYKYEFAFFETDALSLLPQFMDDSSKSRVSEHQKIGALAPVIVWRQGNESFIIDGVKRVAEINHGIEKKVSCAVIVKDFNFCEAGLLRIFSNKDRTVTFNERLGWFKWLRTCFNEKQSCELALQLGFGVKLTREIEQILQCPEDGVDVVASGKVHPELASDFCRFSQDERALFLHTFDGLQLSLQTQREFFEWLPEIAYTSQRNISQLLTDSSINTIITSAVLSAPQKIEKIREHLFTLRYPTFSATKEQWRAITAKVNPAPGVVAFIPDQAFEKDRLEVRLTVTSADQACSITKALAAISAQTWKKLIAPFGS